MRRYFVLTKKRIQAMGKFQRLLYLACILSIALFAFSTFSFSSRYPLNYVNIGIAIFMAICIVAYEFLYEEIRFDEYFFFLFLFCFLVLCSSLMNQTAISMSKSLFTQAILSLFLFQFVKNRDHLRDALLAFLVGGTLFTVYFAFHYRYELLHFSIQNNLGRLGDYFDNQNNVARDFVLLGLVSFYLAICKKQWWLLPHTLVMGFFTLSTGSISNLACFLIATLVMAVHAARGKKKWIVVGTTLALIAVAIMLLQLPQLSYYQKRLMNMLASLLGGGSGDSSANERFELAKDAFFFFLKSPIFGNGYNYVAQHTVGGFAHNNFLEILADYGLFAFVAFQALLILPLAKMRKGEHSLEKLFFALVFYLFIFQIFLVTYYAKLDYIVLAFAFGLISEKRIGCFSVTFKQKKLRLGFSWNGPRSDNGLLLKRVTDGHISLDVDKYRIGK